MRKVLTTVRVLFVAACLLALALCGCSSTVQRAGETQSSGQARVDTQPSAAGEGAQEPSTETATGQSDSSEQEGMSVMRIQLEANGRVLQATLEDNSSASAFAALLADGPLVVDMHDYASMEKVGSLPQSLPRNDEQITTEPGDIILYQGNQVTVYYDENTWSFTRLGHVEGVGSGELRDILGAGDVEVTFSLA